MTMRLLSMSVGLSDVTSDARKPAPYATLNAALYLSPGAASRNRETSSGLRTMGSLWGWRTNGRWLAILDLSLIHISEPTRLGMISYAVFCLKKKKREIKRMLLCII